MPYNGAGTFQVYTPGTPYVTGTIISSTIANNVNSDFATGLSTCITKNGQTTVTANIPLGGFKLTGVAVATARTDAATLATIQDGTGVYAATVGGTANDITLTASPVIPAYVAGQKFSFIASGTNTTAVTVAISSLAVKAVTKNGSTALIAGDILSNALVTIEYDGTRFQFHKDASSGANSDITSLTGLTTPLFANNYFSGGAMTTASGSTQVTISAWFGANSTNAVMFSLPAIIKANTTWVVGNGNGGKALAAAIGNNWYHFYAIRRPDTGVVDSCFTTHAESTGLTSTDFVAGGGNVPDAYTQWRYLGSALSSGGTFVGYTTLGNRVYWNTPFAEQTNATVSTTKISIATHTPAGTSVIGIYNVSIENTGAHFLRLYGGTEDDLAVTVDNATIETATAATRQWTVKEVITVSNSTGLVWRADGSTTGCNLQTLGWIYAR